MKTKNYATNYASYTNLQNHFSWFMWGHMTGMIELK